MSDLLQHASPNCTGEWQSVSTTHAKRRLKLRVTTKGRHLYCRQCRAHYPDHGDHQREYHRLCQAKRHMDRAMLEHEATQAMAVAMRGEAPDEGLDVDGLADAALAGLRSSFFRVERDLGARYKWEQSIGDQAQPATEAVSAILDGAFSNWRIIQIQSDVRPSGSLLYVVELERREPSQEVAVAARIATVEPPPPWDEIEVEFCEHGVAA